MRYLIAAIVVLALLGAGTAVFWDYGRTDRTHFDPVMP